MKETNSIKIEHSVHVVVSDTCTINVEENLLGVYLPV